jgi:hypothetical protein
MGPSKKERWALTAKECVDDAVLTEVSVKVAEAATGKEKAGSEGRIELHAANFSHVKVVHADKTVAKETLGVGAWQFLTR